MKTVQRDKHILSVLKGANSNLLKAILKNCDDRVIQTISEILHNTLIGNISLEPKHIRKLKRYKSQLRQLHQYIRKNKLTKKRRSKFVNQVGGFWPILLEAALSSLASYGINKLFNDDQSKQNVGNTISAK